MLRESVLDHGSIGRVIEVSHFAEWRFLINMFWPLNDENWIWWISAISALMFVGTLVLLPYLIIRIPEDYFVRRPVVDWKGRHPLIHLALVVSKNLAGAILLVAGLAMLLLPGQGLLTILMGILLIDFPGKRRWEARLIRIQSVHKAANWIRRKYGHPPLKLDR